MVRRFAAVGMVALALGPVSGAGRIGPSAGADRQLAVQGTQERATFRSGVDLVTVDVAVLGAAGEPLNGLSASDFELSVDGSARRVVWAEFIRRETRPFVSASSDHFSTNESGGQGRLVVVAVDQAHIRRTEGLPALRAAAAFIDRLDPDDRVAAASLSQAEPLRFSSDRSLAKKQLERLSGSANSAPVFYNIGLTEALAISEGSRIALEQVVRRECGASLGQLTDVRRLAESTSVMDPCPAQVELEGRSIAQQARTDARISLNALRSMITGLGEMEGPKTIVLVSEGITAEPQLFDLSALGAAAHDARVTIYVLKLELPMLDASDSRISPTISADLAVRADGLARIAGAARGAMFPLVGSDPQPFRRILAELSAHYLLAFEPLAGDRDGRTHRLDVKVRNRGALVRARPSFRIPSAPHADTTETELVRLLRDPRSVTDLPLRVGTYTFRRPEGMGIRTLVAAETAREQDVTVGYVLVNRNGVIAASGAGAATSGRYVATADIPDGSYMLKVAIIDRAGRRGSVERHFDAKLGKAGAVPFGDLMLAEPGVGPAQALQPVVASLRGDVLVVYLELYAEDGWTPGQEHVRVEVTAGDMASAVLIPATIERAAPGRWTVTARTPLQNLQPGARLAVVTITAPGGDPVRLSRAFAVDR